MIQCSMITRITMGSCSTPGKLWSVYYIKQKFPLTLAHNSIHIIITYQSPHLLTGFMKINTNRTCGILRIINLKYLIHSCASL